MKMDLGSCLICKNTSLSSNYSESHDLQFGTLGKFIKQLGLIGQGLLFTGSPSKARLCDDCHSGVMKTVVWREEVDEVERDVRSLQRIILKMMRQLKSLQGNYLEEMRRLQGKMKDPEPTLITTAIHQGIRAVVTDLGVFQDGLPAQQLAPSSTSTPNAVPAAPQQEIPDQANIATSDNSIKIELELSCHSYSEMAPEIEKDLRDPLSSEKDNQIDMEHVIYSQNIVKQDPLFLEDTQDEDAVPPTASASPLKSRKKIRKKHGPCQYCGKVCDSRWKLQHHMYKHTGERPYKCHLCPMAFTINPHLKRHMMIHSGKKPFTCPQCKKGFYRKDTFDNHKLGHSEEKPFSCQICGTGFVERHLMIKHMKRKHVGNNAN